MKTIKTLGLTSITALVAMALVGPPSASAESTSLCEVDANPCPSGKLIVHIHLTSSGHSKLLTSLLTIECNALLLVLVVTSGGLGSPLRLSVTMTFTNCLNGCEAKEIGGPSTLTVLKEGSELAKVTGEGLVLVNCSAFGLHCTYVGTGLVGHALGSLTSELTGEIRIEGVEIANDPSESLSFCPSTSKLDLLVKPLNSIFVSW